jgi:uncharacterized protein (DUF885 family)
LRRLLADSDETWLDHYPLVALYRGDPRPVTRFGEEFSEAHVAAMRAAARADLKRLAAIDRGPLAPTDRIAYDTFRWNKTLELRRFGPTLSSVWLRLPLNSYFESWHIEFPSLSSGTGIAPYRTVADYDSGLARIDGYLTFLDRAVIRLREGAARGVVQPRLMVEDMIRQFDEFIAQGVEASTFHGPIGKLPVDMAPADRDRLTQSYRTVIRDRLLPTFVRARDFLKREYLPKSRDTVGLSQIPGGADYYRLLVEEHTSTSTSPEEIHRLGLAEVARIKRSMEEIKHRVGFEGSLAQFFEYIRTDQRFKPASAQSLADGYRVIGATVSQALPRLFRILPRTALELRPVPAATERSAPGAYYDAGSVDGSRPGVFFFNTYDLPSRTIETMETLYLHEAVPGHHLQASLRRENLALPDVLRFGWNTAYIEGWALYAESLGSELGMFTDPYQRFGAYSYEMLRAMRLVVDTGLHMMGWPRDQAIDYIVANSAFNRARAAQEVDRYIANPGQALAYKVGQLTIARLRATAERALGPAFDIREFHDEVLSTGALPMAVLEAKINSWIAARKTP